MAAWNAARRDVREEAGSLLRSWDLLCGYNFDARYLSSTEAVALGESKFCGVGALLKVHLGIYFRTFSSALDPLPAAGSHWWGGNFSRCSAVNSLTAGSFLWVA